MAALILGDAEQGRVENAARGVTSPEGGSGVRRANQERPVAVPGAAATTRSARHASVLVVDDDADLRDVLTRLLEGCGYGVHTADDGDEGLRLALTLAPDAVLLDIGLPGRDGLEVARELRRRGSDVMIIMVTGRREEVLAGLAAGADDFVAKPFYIDELRARVGAVLRRRASCMPATALRLADLIVDPLARRATRGGRQLTLTPTEFDLLLYLARRAGEVVTLDVVAIEVWKHSHKLSSQTYAVILGSLRRKLHAGAPVRLLHTVRGKGYVLEA